MDLLYLVRERVVCGLICLLVTQTTIAYGQLRASFARTNITPSTSKNLLGYGPRMSEGIRDSLYHKVVILDDGVTQFYWVATDICTVAPVIYDQVVNRLNKEFNIDRENFWWSTTHTHSAPEVGPAGVFQIFQKERYEQKYDEEYVRFVEDKLVEAIATARQKLTPARLGMTRGFSKANINRRARNLNNRAYLGENPNGPIDHKFGLIRIETDTGAPIALIANYPIHGTVLATSDLRISGDVPGVVAYYVESQTGIPLLFINGALGNVAPRFSVPVYNSGNKDAQLNQFKQLLGEPILEANNRLLGTTSAVILQTSELIIETPRREDLYDWPEDMAPYLRTSSTGEALIRFPVRFLAINQELLIWGTPCELFCEISNEIRNNSPFPYTFNAGITNGTFGYLCTAEEIKLGGYEPSASPFSPQAEFDLKQGVLAEMQRLKKH